MSRVLAVNDLESKVPSSYPSRPSSSIKFTRARQRQIKATDSDKRHLFVCARGPAAVRRSGTRRLRRKREPLERERERERKSEGGRESGRQGGGDKEMERERDSDRPLWGDARCGSARSGAEWGGAARCCWCARPGTHGAGHRLCIDTATLTVEDAGEAPRTSIEGGFPCCNTAIVVRSRCEPGEWGHMGDVRPCAGPALRPGGGDRAPDRDRTVQPAVGGSVQRLHRAESRSRVSASRFGGSFSRRGSPIQVR